MIHWKIHQESCFEPWKPLRNDVGILVTKPFLNHFWKLRKPHFGNHHFSYHSKLGNLSHFKNSHFGNLVSKKNSSPYLAKISSHLNFLHVYFNGDLNSKNSSFVASSFSQCKVPFLTWLISKGNAKLTIFTPRWTLMNCLHTKFNSTKVF